jgi:hypothetical protein
MPIPASLAGRDFLLIKNVVFLHLIEMTHDIQQGE